MTAGSLGTGLCCPCVCLRDRCGCVFALVSACCVFVRPCPSFSSTQPRYHPDPVETSHPGELKGIFVSLTAFLCVCTHLHVCAWRPCTVASLHILSSCLLHVWLCGGLALSPTFTCFSVGLPRAHATPRTVRLCAGQVVGACVDPPVMTRAHLLLRFVTAPSVGLDRCSCLLYSLDSPPPLPHPPSSHSLAACLTCGRMLSLRVASVSPSPECEWSQ